MKTLNSEQYEAIHYIGNSLILAGPGSGKTTVIVNKVISLLKHNVKEPFSLLALTFTDKAAKEMEERIRRLGYYDKQRLFVGTFHSFSNKVLKRYIGYLKIAINREYDICNQDDIINSLRPNLNTFALKRYISAKKNEGLLPDINVGYDKNLSEEFYLRYQRTLIDNNLLDFDDILLYTKILFEKDPVIRRIYQNAFKYIIVDEFQDTNKLQYELVKQLALSTTNKVFCVADDDQLIYSWRGASTGTIKLFVEDFDPNIIKLINNYRCPKQVVEVSQKLININDDRYRKTIVANNSEDVESIFATRLTSREKEIEYLITQVNNAIQEKLVTNLGEIAIFARRNNELIEIKEVFERDGIPYYCSAEDTYKDEAETELTVYALRLVSNINDKYAYEKLATLLGYDDYFLDDTDEKELLASLINLSNKFKEIGSSNLILKEIVKNTIRMLNIKEFINKEVKGETQRKQRIDNYTNFYKQIIKISSKKKSLGDLLIEIDHSEAVHIMSAHSGKGLEYKIVFVTNLVNGNFPSNQSIQNDDIKEERRLFYVAITRTKLRLYLTYSSPISNKSIFLSEIGF